MIWHPPEEFQMILTVFELTDSVTLLATSTYKSISGTISNNRGLRIESEGNGLNLAASAKRESAAMIGYADSLVFLSTIIFRYHFAPFVCRGIVI